MKKHFTIVMLLSSIVLTAAPGKIIKGKWLGQKLPGNKAEIFAPGIVSTGMYERDLAFSPAGDELFFRIFVKKTRTSRIIHMKIKDGVWTKPEVAAFSPADMKHSDLEPVFSPDGKSLYFVSNRPGSVKNSFDIWRTDKKDGKWQKPVHLPGPVNSEHNEYFPSLTKNGKLYFTGKRGKDPNEYIFSSTLKKGVYTDVKKLGKNPNGGIARYNAFISADESFIIVPQYIKVNKKDYESMALCFRSAEGKWSKPIDLNPYLNVDNKNNHSIYITPDGKLMFFMGVRNQTNKELFGDKITYKKLQQNHNNHKNSKSNIYWIDASFIKDLKKKAVWK